MVPKERRDKMGVFLRQVRTKEKKNTVYAKQKQTKRAMHDASKSKDAKNKKQQQKSKRKSSSNWQVERR